MLFRSMCANGWISFELGAALVLGENIGTTITANLAALTGNTQARRAAYSFNPALFDGGCMLQYGAQGDSKSLQPVLSGYMQAATLSFIKARPLLSCPVSYTHLDVYKRQSPFYAPYPALPLLLCLLHWDKALFPVRSERAHV